MSEIHQIASPLPGIFYRRPSPGAELLVEVGSTVRQGDTLGLIEIMKSFHAITSTTDGEVVSIADDMAEVAPGAVLAEIRPAEFTS
jgi:biotin carboxyl carrier protein